MHGTNVQKSRYERYENLFVINGVGGRGFVLSPYLADKLSDFILQNRELDDTITVDRLFTKWVRSKKAKEYFDKIKNKKD